jgi:hypothetical protein
MRVVKDLMRGIVGLGLMVRLVVIDLIEDRVDMSLVVEIGGIMLVEIVGIRLVVAIVGMVLVAQCDSEWVWRPRWFEGLHSSKAFCTHIKQSDSRFFAERQWYDK